MTEFVYSDSDRDICEKIAKQFIKNKNTPGQVKKDIDKLPRKLASLVRQIYQSRKFSKF